MRLFFILFELQLSLASKLSNLSVTWTKFDYYWHGEENKIAILQNNHREFKLKPAPKYESYTNQLWVKIEHF